MQQEEANTRAVKKAAGHWNLVSSELSFVIVLVISLQDVTVSPRINRCFANSIHCMGIIVVKE
jgi:hypothetical protein